jgi:hypothetical protein
VIKVTLERIRPPIWRRLEVPAELTLADLHQVIQAAMGWTDSHMHAFEVGGAQYSDPEFDSGNNFRDENAITLARALPREKATMRYEYDFGDSWRHRIVLEKILPAGERGGVVCLAGKRACPLEDCGGIPGYYQLLGARHSPDDPELREILEWAQDFDPEHFDLAELNERLARAFG